MSEYPNNSLKYRSSLDGTMDKKTKKTVGFKDEKERPKKVVEGEVKVKKKSFMKRLLDSIIKEDLPGIKSKLIDDVILPNIQDSAFSLLNNTLAIIFGRKPMGRGASINGRTSYQAYYERRGEVPVRKPAYDVMDIFFATRAEAEEVLSQMDAIFEKYDVATVADYYDLAGVTPEPSDFKIGWFDITNATVVNTRDGYLIKLPRVRTID